MQNCSSKSCKIATNIVILINFCVYIFKTIIIHTYYSNKERSAIRQYEYENFLLEYRAYKALRGNSFIDRIYQEVKTWDIVS